MQEKLTLSTAEVGPAHDYKQQPDNPKYRTSEQNVATRAVWHQAALSPASSIGPATASGCLRSQKSP